MRYRTAHLLLALTLAPTFQSGLALAQPAGAPAGQGKSAALDIEARRATYERARTLLTQARFAEAERLFLQLWAESPTYDVALNLADMEMHLKRYRDAAEHITYAMKHFAPREDTQVAKAFREDLNEAKRHIATVFISVSHPGATVLVDGRPLGLSPLGSEIFLDPGRHLIEARLDGFTTAQQTIAAEAGAEHKLNLQLTESQGIDNAAANQSETRRPPVNGALATGPTTDSSPMAPPSPPQRSAVPAIVALSGAGVGLVTGIVFAVASNNAADRRDELKEQRADGTLPCSRGTPTPGICAELRDEADATVRYRTLAITGFGVAAVGLATGYLLFPSGRSDSVRVSITPSHLGLFAGMSGRF